MSKTFQPGNIIENRNRLWRVNREIDDVIHASPLDGSGRYEEKFYKPVENITDGRITPPSGDIVGNPALQNMLLTAYQLDLIYGTAPLISLKKSRVIPTEYQLVPVAMALDMPKVRLLLADDVGLGKTIEAGLIITELMARNRVSKILFITPANLREQWKEEMEYFFHLQPKIISRRHKRMLERQLPPGTNPWEYFDQLIVSMDYAKREEVKAQIESQKWDLILIDEAHKVAKPHQISSSNTIDKIRWDFVTKTMGLSDHLLLLTATPHNGFTDSFASLLYLLDVDAVRGELWDPVIDRDIAKKFICQRRRKDIEEWLKKSGKDEKFFPERDQKEEIISLTDKEKNVIAKLEKLTGHIKKSSERSTRYGKRLAKWTIMHLHKRALSSPEAFRFSLINRIEKLESMHEEKEDYESEKEHPGIEDDEARAVATDDDPGEELTEEEAGIRLEKVVYSRIEDVELELEHLEAVLEEAKKVTRTYDSKLQTLYDILERRLSIKGKIIIFTKWIDTQRYIKDSLTGRKKFKDYEIFELNGTMGDGERRDIFMDFETSKKAILIATDCISEGLNLQYSCSQMIHYELPWNPNRLEQRNGRIDRFGQKDDKVYIRTLVMQDTLDASILKVLIEKSYRIKEDYGFSPPFFGDRTTLLEMISEQGVKIGVEQSNLLNFADIQDTGRVIEDPFSEETIDRIRNDSFYDSGNFDFEDIRKRMKETTEKVGDVETLKDFVFGALRKFGYNIKHNEAGLYVFEPSSETKKYRGEIGKEFVNVTFNPERAAENSRLELMDISHPLVRQLIENLKQEAFDESTSFYGRTACWCNDNVDEVTVVHNILIRYAVKTKPISILEEIVSFGFPLYPDGGIGDDDLIYPEDASELLRSDKHEHGRIQQELLDDLKKASEMDLSEHYRNIADINKKRIIEERKNFVSSFDDDQGWIKGMLDVEVASLDHLTTTIIYPKLGG